MADTKFVIKEVITQRITGLIEADTLDKLGKYYDDQADTYDQDMDAFEYTGPNVGANMINKFVAAKNVRILDVACGTGLVGEKLRDIGYTDIDGLDGNAKSIENARKKNIYNNLYVEWLGGDNRTSITDGCYDVIVCVGGFAINHLKSDCFDEFIRVIKPGGYIIIIIRSVWLDSVPCYSDGKLEGDMNALELDGKWKFIEKGITKEEDSAQDNTTFVLQKC